MPQKIAKTHKLQKFHVSLKDELKKHDFRVTIFGSARIKANEKVYKQVVDLAKKIGEQGFDVVTGGGPGLMEAATIGHNLGDPEGKSETIGLTIELPWESEDNGQLEIKKHFEHFSGRLDHFMALSSAIVVTPGGIGTCLELFYTWQLVQVKHICPVPIILIGSMWKKLIDWTKKYPLKEGLISPQDFSSIYVVKNNKEAMKVIMKTYHVFLKEGKNYCLNVDKYQLDED